VDPAWLSTAVENCVNQNHVFFDSVINGKRKLLCQKAIITRMLLMDARKKCKRIYIREKRIKEISTKAYRLGFVKTEALLKVIFGRIKDFYSHARFFLMRFFACCQSEDVSLPVS